MTIKKSVITEITETLTGNTINKNWAIKAMLIPSGKFEAYYKLV